MAQDTSRKSTLPRYLALALAVLAVGVFGAAWLSNASLAVAGEAGPEAFDSQRIPIGSSPVAGPEDAKITIVEFSDFQCPFCAKTQDTLNKVKEKYGDKVRIVYKHYPLPFHHQAKKAAYAAMAAGEQGKFWEMHDKLFANQKKFEAGQMKQLVTSWAEQIDGLDVKQFEKDYTGNQSEYEAQIKKEVTLGKKIGIKGTPGFFINGEKLSGAQPFSKFKSVIDDRLQQADRLLEGGTKRADLYAKAVKKNFEAPSKPEPKKKQKKETRNVEYVPVNDDDPVTGAEDDYLITIVEFGDFECPFTKKATSTVEKIKKNYGDRVRIVWKDLPLPFHKNAEAAGRAAIAAHKQGKFWEMHDLLFENQKRLGEQGVFKELASKLDLDVEQFRKDMQSDQTKEMLESDTKLSGKVGAKGTPNFWINGVNVVGAQSYREFENLIEEQLKLAKRLKKEEGITGKKLYKKAVQQNEDEFEPEDKDEDSKKGGFDGFDDKQVGEKLQNPDVLKIGNSPVKGPKDAPVTIYEFSDFECPYCAKARKTLQPILEDYKGKVKVVHKNYPLPFHKNAKAASKAALAAKQQGKFWEMYHLLFENQDRLGQQGLYIELAKEIGLDVDTFKDDMDKEALEKEIKEDKKLGQKIGVKGTPAFVIGGWRVVGAQPGSAFRSVIERALKNSE